MCTEKGKKGRQPQGLTPQSLAAHYLHGTIPRQGFSFVTCFEHDWKSVPQNFPNTFFATVHFTSLDAHLLPTQARRKAKLLFLRGKPVTKVVGCRPDDQGSILGRGKTILSSPQHPDLLWDPLSLSLDLQWRILVYKSGRARPAPQFCGILITALYPVQHKYFFQNKFYVQIKISLHKLNFFIRSCTTSEVLKHKFVTSEPSVMILHTSYAFTLVIDTHILLKTNKIQVRKLFYLHSVKYTPYREKNT
jgi:hypothetical protein